MRSEANYSQSPARKDNVQGSRRVISQEIFVTSLPLAAGFQRNRNLRLVPRQRVVSLPTELASVVPGLCTTTLSSGWTT
jgi:hypothetical protein